MIRPPRDSVTRYRLIRRGFQLICASVLALLLGRTAIAASVFDPARVGPPRSGATAELFRPEGTGPFPAIVVLHGCDGIGRHYRDWARRLVNWGYVALLVDSFTPRGHRSVCNQGRLVPPETRAEDAFAAKAWLATQPYVRPERIGVIGFSHGGWTVLRAVLAGDRPAPPFAAAVAYYPGCQRTATPLVTDTLILIGGADDWTPASSCRGWAEHVDRAGHTVDLVIYPNAHHGFDSRQPPHRYAGHLVGRDDSAADASIATTQIFLAARLGAP